MAEADLHSPPARAAAEPPLAGMTVLVVEDSRFAAEALRLICLRAGARLRRTDSLAQADRHLGLYVPDCLIVDCGLPDGDGCSLITRRHLAPRRPPVILGLSGDHTQKARVMAAGADGFLSKPLPGLPQLLRLMRPHLASRAEWPPAPVTGALPDVMALQDDLRHALEMLGRSAMIPRYVASFLGSIAVQSGDPELGAAAADYRNRPQDAKRLRALLSSRLDDTGRLSASAFGTIAASHRPNAEDPDRPPVPRPEISHLRPPPVTLRTGPA